MKSYYFIFVFFFSITQVFSQEKNRKLAILVNNSLRFNFYDLNFDESFEDGTQVKMQNKKNKIAFYPSISLIKFTKNNNIFEFELDNINFDRERYIKNIISLKGNSTTRFNLGLRNGFSFVKILNSSKSKLILGSQVYIYNNRIENTGFYLDFDGIKQYYPFGVVSGSYKLLGSNFGINIKFYKILRKNFLFQSQFLIEPLGFQLYNKEIFRLKFLKRNFNREEQILEYYRQNACLNCGVLQVKFSIGPKF